VIVFALPKAKPQSRLFSSVIGASVHWEYMISQLTE
jgi:hypothetical protein